jgi:hypothetical protein
MDEHAGETFPERMARLRGLKKGNGNGGGNGKGILGGLERQIRGLKTWQLAVGGVALVAIVDWAIAPKGMSHVAKLWDKLGGGPRALPPPPLPPPPVLSPAQVAAKGEFAGANNMAGWNRGQSNYFQWPGDVWQWKPHGGPWHNWHNEPWQYGNMTYPWAQ